MGATSLLKVGAEDKPFGSITNKDIAAALKAQHRVDIDRHKIDLKEPIKVLGEHQVSLKLHRDVNAQIQVEVVPIGVEKLEEPAEPAPAAQP